MKYESTHTHSWVDDDWFRCDIIIIAFELIFMQNFKSDHVIWFSVLFYSIFEIHNDQSNSLVRIKLPPIDSTY